MKGLSSIADSPWLWALLFSVFGLILLFIFHPKYRDLQSMRERQYQARERTGPIEFELEAMAARRDYATPENTLIPVYPLAVLLGAVAALSLAMLTRALLRDEFARWREVHQVDERWLGQVRRESSDDPSECPP